MTGRMTGAARQRAVAALALLACAGVFVMTSIAGYSGDGPAPWWAIFFAITALTLAGSALTLWSDRQAARSARSRLHSLQVRNAWPGIGLAVTGFAAFVYYVARVWPWTVDDSFITFRYSWMLGHGHGANFNATGHHVEGYTSFLWVLLLAIPESLGFGSESFAKGGGVLLTLIAFGAGALLAVSWCRRLPRREQIMAAGVSVFALGTLPSTAIHASAGMETALSLCLLTLLCACASRYVQRLDAGSSRLLAVAALFAGLTRPENNLFALVAIGSAFVLVQRGRTRLVRDVAFLYALPAAVYFAVRFLYYGNLFPIPFYIKLSGGHLQGLAPVEAYGQRMALFIAFALVALYRPERRMVPSVAVVGAVMLFGIFPAYITGYEFRFVFPATALLCAICGVGVARTSAAVVGQTLPIRATGALVIGIFAVAVAVWRTDLQTSGVRSVRVDAAGPNAGRAELGRFLGRYQGPTPTIALQDAGAVPYYSRWRVIDFFGLNDNEIGINRNHDPTYVLTRNPDVIIIPSFSTTELQNNDLSAQALFAEAVKHNLQPIIADDITGLGNWLLLARPGSPVAKYLVSWRSPHVTALTWGIPLPSASYDRKGFIIPTPAKTASFRWVTQDGVITVRGSIGTTPLRLHLKMQSTGEPRKLTLVGEHHRIVATAPSPLPLQPTDITLGPFTLPTGSSMLTLHLTPAAPTGPSAVVYGEPVLVTAGAR